MEVYTNVERPMREAKTVVMDGEARHCGSLAYGAESLQTMVHSNVERETILKRMSCNGDGDVSAAEVRENAERSISHQLCSN